MESGQDFQVTVKFIEYDALYQRVIFGKIGSGLELLEELNEETLSNNQISDDLTVKEMPEEAKQEELVAEVAPKEIIDDSLEVSTDEVIEKDKLAPQVIAFAPGQSNESDSEESVSSERNYAVGIDDEPSNKIAAIAALRSVREGMSLADAKALIESTPFIIKSNCTEDEANQIQAKFHRAGANVYQATNEEWDDIIANKQSPLVERSTVAENSGPTFGADSAGVSNVSYDEGEPREASPFPSSDEAHQEVNNTNCSSGCVALGFYVIGGLMILFWSGVENFITGLVFIGIGYAIQRASDTK